MEIIEEFDEFGAATEGLVTSKDVERMPVEDKKKKPKPTDYPGSADEASQHWTKQEVFEDKTS